MFDFLKSKKDNKKPQDIFVIIIFAYFGDALVGNSLIQNIKRLYPDSKTVFIINKQYYDVAKYQKDVDEVIPFDKNGEHKGLLGILKFVWNFPYKNIKCLFKMCKKTRANVISFLLRPKKTVNYDDNIMIPAHKRYSEMLKKITNEEIKYLPIVYNVDKFPPEKFKDLFVKDKKYIAFCPLSSNIKKDIPINTAIELINKFVSENYEIVLVGTGIRAVEYADELRKNNCKFLDLVNKTTIYELAQVIKNCEGMISVDTGTMHLGYACNVPSVCLFYMKKNITGWAPDEKLYPHTVIPNDNSFEGIYGAYKNLLKKLNI